MLLCHCSLVSLGARSLHRFQFLGVSSWAVKQIRRTQEQHRCEGSGGLERPSSNFLLSNRRVPLLLAPVGPVSSWLVHIYFAQHECMQGRTAPTPPLQIASALSIRYSVSSVFHCLTPKQQLSESQREGTEPVQGPLPKLGSILTDFLFRGKCVDLGGKRFHKYSRWRD